MTGVGDTRSVKALKALLQVRPDLADELQSAIKAADIESIDTIDAFASYVNRQIRSVPTSRDLFETNAPFFYIIGRSEGLKRSVEFQDWAKGVATEEGHFLDSPQSIAGLATFYADPAMRLDDYTVAPSGWQSFNQFFAREFKPGKRIIAGIGDNSTVVAPADGIFKGALPITDEASIVAKGFSHAIPDLLEDSDYGHSFAGGCFVHCFQQVNDYHRFHVPFAGTIVERKSITGTISVDVIRASDGAFALTDGEGFQFQQQRGMIVIETDSIGHVAVLPIGMGHVGSVELTPDVGAVLHKGEQFGFFQFGGSDVILLFQKDAVDITAEVGRHYLMGEAIGNARGRSR